MNEIDIYSDILPGGGPVALAPGGPLRRRLKNKEINIFQCVYYNRNKYRGGGPLLIQ